MRRDTETLSNCPSRRASKYWCFDLGPDCLTPESGPLCYYSRAWKTIFLPCLHRSARLKYSNSLPKSNMHINLLQLGKISDVSLYHRHIYLRQSNSGSWGKKNICSILGSRNKQMMES